MLYLLDANVLINANRDYYPISRVPEYWEWLISVGNEGLVKIPIEFYEEINEGNDDLAKWLKQEDVIAALLLNEEAEQPFVADTINKGYASDLTDVEVEQIGCDPFLIAYALVNPAERCVVTTEVSKPSAKRANRHIPDVCDQLGVKHCNQFEFGKKLDFRTNGNRSERG